MFGWFKKKPAGLQPEAKWTVSADESVLRVTDHKGETKLLPTGELSGIIIETKDSGPWGADVWWLLFDAADQLACSYPQGATGEDAVLDYLMKLPGFDHEKMTDAMRSTDNAVFPVWRR